MIRASLCLLLIVASTLLAVPVQAAEGPRTSAVSSLIQPLASVSSSDPNGKIEAFNATLSRFDLYTNSSATLSPTSPDPGASLTWYSRINNTETGAPVPGTAFNYRVNNNTAITPQTVSWNLTIPPPSQGSTTFVKFRWNGTLGAGTSARYLIFNGTSLNPFVNVTLTGPRTITGASYLNATDKIPLTCASIDECIIVSPTYVGLNLILSFVFKSNSTGKGINVHVQNVMVATSNLNHVQADSHSMDLQPSNVKVDHTGKITLTYNSTVTYTNRYTNLSTVHTWSHMLVTFFMPVSYNQSETSIDIDGVPVFPAPYPLFRGPCGVAFCTNSSFISLNMTSPLDRAANRTATINTTSLNALVSIRPLLGGVATNFWNSGDSIGVQMKSSPGVNVTASQIVVLRDPTSFTQVNRTFTNKGGTYLYNTTISASAPLGLWTITGTFLSGYDYGRQTHQIRVENLKTVGLTRSGGLGQGNFLSIQGRLTFASNSTSTPAGTNVTAFAIDAGSPPAPVTTTAPAGSGLYVSNFTLVNPVFKQDQPLATFFTVTNSQVSSPFLANATIEHEWYEGAGGSHGVTTTIPLTLGDEPFNLVPSYVYRLDVELTTSGIRLTVKSVTTNNKVTVSPTVGTDGVPSARPHFGSFKITINSAPVTPGGSSSVSSIRSPTYAYMVTGNLVPSRLLDSSPTVIASSTGAFNATIRGDKLLGAKRLELFVLARHPNGITLQSSELTSISDSSILTPTSSGSSEATLGQSYSVSLNLENNSTLPVTLIVNLVLSGQGSTSTVSTNTVSIAPNGLQSTVFTFTAPSQAGSYLLTFSSPQYGLLLTRTLQVSLLQSNLQILIPVIVGLVAALIIIGVYLIQKRPEKESEEEGKKPRPSGKQAKPPGPARNP